MEFDDLHLQSSTQSSDSSRHTSPSRRRGPRSNLSQLELDRARADDYNKILSKISDEKHVELTSNYIPEGFWLYFNLNFCLF